MFSTSPKVIICFPLASKEGNQIAQRLAGKMKHHKLLLGDKNRQKIVTGGGAQLTGQVCGPPEWCYRLSSFPGPIQV